VTSDCRAAAASVLARVIGPGQALDVPLAEAQEAVKPRDRALLQQLCYGTLRQYPRLEGILRQVLAKPLKKKDMDVHALLLLGLHQLLDMRTPDHAAISTAVEACRSLGKPWATRLVNGILRRCLRERDSLEHNLADHERLAHPDWLLALLSESWPTQWQELVAANNENPPMCLRVNRRANDRDSYRERLAAAGIESEDCQLSPDGLRLVTPVDIGQLPGFADGLVSVQDEAAQLAAPLLSPVHDERILDACAAPGGKACHLLEWQPGLAELVAMDKDPARLARVEENLQRLGLDATLVCGDAGEPPPGFTPGSFDRILVDAPCSGTGVIRRHPDIKVLRRPGDIPAFAVQQLRILEGLWPLLRSGGRLLYVTCSVLPEENAACVEGFIEATPDAGLESLELSWGEDAAPGRQLLHRPGGADGLYFASIRKQD
jgi:16S rRNA (cytosine967-C5)-methyltransferase